MPRKPEVIKFLHFECKCGTVAEGVGLGLTSSGDVFITWYCQGCGENVAVRMPIRKLRGECPVLGRDGVARLELAAHFDRSPRGAQDARFLRALKVTW